LDSRCGRCESYSSCASFQPTKDDPIDFEHMIEETLLDLKHRFRLREVYYDPHQM
jgi:hypothetical protein